MAKRYRKETLKLYRRLAREWGVTPQAIWHVEKRALEKFRREWLRLYGREAA